MRAVAQRKKYRYILSKFEPGMYPNSTGERKSKHMKFFVMDLVYSLLKRSGYLKSRPRASALTYDLHYYPTILTSLSLRNLRCRSIASAEPRRCGCNPRPVLPPVFCCLPLVSIGFCYVLFPSLIFYCFPYVSIYNRIDSCSYFA